MMSSLLRGCKRVDTGSSAAEAELGTATMLRKTRVTASSVSLTPRGECSGLTRSKLIKVNKYGGRTGKERRGAAPPVATRLETGKRWE